MLFLLLASCAPSQPRLDADVRVRPDGVTVAPAARVNFGALGVTVRP